MTDTNRPQISTTEDMLSRLPYELTTGVTATREGLVTHGYYGQIITELTTEEWEDTYEGEGGWGLIPWPDAAKRLRYHEGEPFAFVEEGYYTVQCAPVDATKGGGWRGAPVLHRLAAILCDDAEAFRVLHWCVTEMGGK